MQLHHHMLKKVMQDWIFQQLDMSSIKNIILLKSDTIDIVEYVEKTIDKNKKNYKFWNLINNNE